MTKLDDAFDVVARADFLPPKVKPFADLDRALAIGHDATNSQPWTVRYMLEHLDPQPGDKVLDVGSGSGWTTALLAYLVGESGSVVGVDIVPELVQMGRLHMDNRFPWARFEEAEEGVLGWPESAPYDRILVSADGGSVPEDLEAQLAPGGRMVLPASQRIVIVEKDAGGKLTRNAAAGMFSFVELR
ncbi:protein-L-isoaspartate O-methyltransferase family protein [Tessaracoccus sp. Y36]